MGSCKTINEIKRKFSKMSNENIRLYLNLFYPVDIMLRRFAVMYKIDYDSLNRSEIIDYIIRQLK
jgi:hypothetical protein